MKKPITIAGMSFITTNEEAMTQHSIGKFWEKFLNSSVKTDLKNLESTSIFAVYSDYENGYHGKYKYTLGYAVKNTEDVPQNLDLMIIPNDNYKIYPAKSSKPDDIVEAWKTIWELDPKSHPRAFNVDFEEYSENGMTINIAYL